MLCSRPIDIDPTQDVGMADAHADGDGSDTVARDAWAENRLPSKTWWQHVDLTTALRLGRQTFVQVPDRYRGALDTAREKALQVLAAADENGPAEAEWKLVLLLDRLLLSHGRTGATCSELLDERLSLWWGAQWGALWESVCGLPVKSPLAKRGGMSDKQRAKRVHTLAAGGEQGRALTAASSSRPAPRTPETYGKLTALFPESALPPRQRQRRDPPSMELREAVEAEVVHLLVQAPKLTSPGLLGTRLEHLAACRDNPVTLKLLGWMVAKIAFGEVPDQVLSALKTGELAAISKNEPGEIRPLLIGSTLRRLGLRAIVRARKQQLTDAAGSHQYGVGRKAGAQLLYKCLQALVEQRTDAVVLKVDAKAAFQRMERQPALEAMHALVPDLDAACEAWYGERSVHLWRDGAGHFKPVESTRGFDQGCPLAAAMYSIGQKTVLEPFLLELQRADPLAKMYSFLDDTYVVVSRGLAVIALRGLQQALRPLDMELHPGKTKVWFWNGSADLPPELAGNFVDSLPVLGAHLKAPGDRQDAPVHLGTAAGQGLTQATRKLSDLGQVLQRLQGGGLSKQAAGALFKTYAGAASQYPLQLEHVTASDAQAYDDVLLRCWSRLAGREFNDAAKVRLCLPARLGGCGVQTAMVRRNAAYWATWAVAAQIVADDLGHSTVADFVEAVPVLSATLDDARQGLADQGLTLFTGVSLADALRQPYPQRLLVGQLQKKMETNLRRSLQTARSAELGGQGGPGAAGFLQYPTDANCSMEDTYWCAALRQRLGLERAELPQEQLHSTPQQCCNVSRSGQQCVATLDDAGVHALTDQIGGGVLLRHDGVTRALGGLIGRWRHAAPLLEQRVPSWDRPRRNPQPWQDPVERAVLDVEYQADAGRMWLDVTVRHPAAGDADAVLAASRKDGEASRRAEREKHARYPGEQLTPFALEIGGRIGAEARLWLLSEIRLLPDDIQTMELARAYRVISCALQTGIVKQLRRASGTK